MDKIKVILLDYNQQIFTYYVNSREELNMLLLRLNKTKWKATRIKAIRSSA